MPRKGPAPRRELHPDPVYRSLLVTQLMNKVMLRGKKSTAEKIVYDALKIVEEKSGAEPIATLKRACDNIKPPLEVRSRRVGGANYQVPVEVRPVRRVALSMRWIREAAQKRGEKSMTARLAGEGDDLGGVPAGERHGRVAQLGRVEDECAREPKGGGQNRTDFHLDNPFTCKATLSTRGIKPRFASWIHARGGFDSRFQPRGTFRMGRGLHGKPMNPMDSSRPASP